LLHRGGNLLAKKTLSVMENSLYSVTLEAGFFQSRDKIVF